MVVPWAMSRMNTSSTWFPSFETRSVARDSNATRSASALIVGWSLASFASLPSRPMLMRSVKKRAPHTRYTSFFPLRSFTASWPGETKTTARTFVVLETTGS